MLKTIIVIFFAINAIFWSLFPHKIHCDVAKILFNNCPSHGIHLLIGITSFIIAFIVAQYDYLKTIF